MGGYAIFSTIGSFLQNTPLGPWGLSTPMVLETHLVGSLVKWIEENILVDIIKQIQRFKINNTFPTPPNFVGVFNLLLFHAKKDSHYSF